MEAVADKADDDKTIRAAAENYNCLIKANSNIKDAMLTPHLAIFLKHQCNGCGALSASAVPGASAERLKISYVYNREPVNGFSFPTDWIRLLTHNDDAVFGRHFFIGEAASRIWRRILPKVPVQTSMMYAAICRILPRFCHNLVS